MVESNGPEVENLIAKLTSDARTVAEEIAAGRSDAAIDVVGPDGRVTPAPAGPSRLRVRRTEPPVDRNAPAIDVVGPDGRVTHVPAGPSRLKVRPANPNPGSK